MKGTKTRPQTGVVIDADPAELVLGPNVRLDAEVGKDFVASIRERGVLEPISAYQDDDDRLVVLRGQRRTVGALQAKRATVPVFLVPAPCEADRVVDQLTENDHRAQLRQHDRVGAYEQLAALGVSATQIAKRTATPKTQVAAALAVAGSEVALQAVQSTEMTLDQAAIVAEFEHDEKAVERILSAVDRGATLDHLVAQLRTERVEAAGIAEAAAPFLAAGLTVVERPGWQSTTRDLEQLNLTESDHSDCPGHALYVEMYWSDEDSDEEDDNAERLYRPVFVCTNPGIHVIQGGPAKAEVDQDAQREAERAERRDVIESNKAWDSATGVRRTWLRGYLARKAAPKTTAFLALALGRAEYLVVDRLRDGQELAHELLGLEAPSPFGDTRGSAIAAALAGVTEARAQVIALGLMLGAYEASLTRECWRRRTRAAAEYLRFIQSQGYELAPVELRACAIGESDD